MSVSLHMTSKSFFTTFYSKKVNTMDFNATQPEGWRQAVCGAALRSARQFVRTIAAYWMAVVLGAGIMAIACAAGLALAWWFGVVRIGSIVTETAAACSWTLSKVIAQSGPKSSQLRVRAAQYACGTNTQPPAYITNKQPPKATAECVSQPDSPSGPETPDQSQSATPFTSCRSSVSDQPEPSQPPKQQAASTTEVAEGPSHHHSESAAAASDDWALLSATTQHWNLTCKVQPLAAALPAGHSPAWEEEMFANFDWTQQTQDKEQALQLLAAERGTKPVLSEVEKQELRAGGKAAQEAAAAKLASQLLETDMALLGMDDDSRGQWFEDNTCQTTADAAELGFEDEWSQLPAEVLAMVLELQSRQ